jgi:hypothetical protein
LIGYACEAIPISTETIYSNEIPLRVYRVRLGPIELVSPVSVFAVCKDR